MAFSFAGNGHNSTIKYSASILFIKLELFCRACCTPGIIPQLMSRYFVKCCRQYVR